MFLSHSFIDLIVQISDLIVTKIGLLDSRDFPGDLLENMTSPFLARWNRVDFCDDLGPSRPSCIDDP